MIRSCEHCDDISRALEGERKGWSSGKSVRFTKKVSASRVVGQPTVDVKWVGHQHRIREQARVPIEMGGTRAQEMERPRLQNREVPTEKQATCAVCCLSEC